MSLHIAVLHHPVYSRDGRVVTTAIANMDIHDIARAAATYGVENFYIINPEPAQKQLAASLINHWISGYGARSNPSRKRAFETVRLADSLAEAAADLEKKSGRKTEIAVTGASLNANLVSWGDMRRMLREKDSSILLLFGTGWGLAGEITSAAHYRLEPLRGPGEYNHLSVRSAVAIALDRLMGTNRT